MPTYQTNPLLLCFDFQSEQVLLAPSQGNNWNISIIFAVFWKASKPQWSKKLRKIHGSHGVVLHSIGLEWQKFTSGRSNLTNRRYFRKRYVWHFWLVVVCLHFGCFDWLSKTSFDIVLGLFFTILVLQVLHGIFKGLFERSWWVLWSKRLLKRDWNCYLLQTMAWHNKIQSDMSKCIFCNKRMLIVVSQMPRHVIKHFADLSTQIQGTKYYPGRS